MAQGPHGLTLEVCNCLSARRLARRVTDYYDQILAPTGLRTTQFVILAAIARLGEPTINGVAEALELDRTTMGKNLRPLERDGLLDIRRSEHDGRSRNLALTDLGRSRALEGRALWAAAQAAMARANGDEPLATLRQAMAKVRIPGEAAEHA